MGRLIMDIEVFNKNYLPAINNIESMTNEKLVDTVPVILEKQFTVLEQTKNKVAQASERAKRAQESARYASEHSAGLFQKRAAIESLQDAVSDVAKAQQSAAEAQELSFEYQKQLANFSKFLLGLGARNMTINRALSRSLEMKMKGASEKELDNLAQQEFLSVIKQLKDQEDIMLKQEDLSKIVRGHDEELKQQDNTLRRQAAKDAEHDKLFQEKARKDMFPVNQ